jgi:hypothetical protein
MRATFKLHAHEVGVVFDVWRGWAVYKVDGNTVSKIKTHKEGSVGRFDLDDGTEVEIRTVTRPWSCQVFVDRRPYIDELFPSLKGASFNKEVYELFRYEVLLNSAPLLATIGVGVAVVTMLFESPSSPHIIAGVAMGLIGVAPYWKFGPRPSHSQRLVTLVFALMIPVILTGVGVRESFASTFQLFGALLATVSAIMWLFRERIRTRLRRGILNGSTAEHGSC